MIYEGCIEDWWSRYELERNENEKFEFADDLMIMISPNLPVRPSEFLVCVPFPEESFSFVACLLLFQNRFNLQCQRGCFAIDNRFTKLRTWIGYCLLSHPIQPVFTGKFNIMSTRFGGMGYSNRYSVDTVGEVLEESVDVVVYWRRGEGLKNVFIFWTI